MGLNQTKIRLLADFTSDIVNFGDQDQLKLPWFLRMDKIYSTYVCDLNFEHSRVEAELKRIA